MTTDDDRIRRLLNAAAPPSRGVAPAEVARQAERVHRRRVRLTVVGAPLLTLSVIAVAVVGARGVGSGDAGPAGEVTPSPTRSTSADALVPWVDTPAGRYVAPKQTPSTPIAAPDCSAADLDVRWGRRDGLTGGTLLYQLILRNNGSSACTLTGYPRVVATEPGQPDVVAVKSRWPKESGGVLEPGESASLAFEDPLICPAYPDGTPSGPTYHGIEITLPGGQAVGAPRSRNGFDVKCGITSDGFVLQRRNQASTTRDPWRDLRVEVAAGAAHVDGGQLVYEVALTNSGSGDISFADRCPSYAEGVKDVANDLAMAKETYQLNCAAAPVIAAGATTRYEMRFRTWDGVGGTAFTISWSLVMPDGPWGTGDTAVLGEPTSSSSPRTGADTYTSYKGVEIVLDDFPSGKAITSPVTITGEVPGSWSFEADFPVELVDGNGRTIARGIGTLEGDWMTEELVPFSVTLTFTPPADRAAGKLFLVKDNPSGEAKFDDRVVIPVSFG